jgi:hypothetical protein
VTIRIIAAKIEAPGIQPTAIPSAITPVMRVRNAATPRAKRILSSKASLILSRRGGI